MNTVLVYLAHLVFWFYQLYALCNEWVVDYFYTLLNYAMWITLITENHWKSCGLFFSFHYFLSAIITAKQPPLHLVEFSNGWMNQFCGQLNNKFYSEKQVGTNWLLAFFNLRKTFVLKSQNTSMQTKAFLYSSNLNRLCGLGDVRFWNKMPKLQVVQFLKEFRYGRPKNLSDGSRVTE